MTLEATFYSRSVSAKRFGTFRYDREQGQFSRPLVSASSPGSTGCNCMPAGAKAGARRP